MAHYFTTTALFCGHVLRGPTSSLFPEGLEDILIFYDNIAAAHPYGEDRQCVIQLSSGAVYLLKNISYDAFIKDVHYHKAQRFKSAS